MKINVDKEKKIIKIGYVDEDNEIQIQRWTFIQIYKPSTTKFLSDVPKEQNDIFEIAFNA